MHICPYAHIRLDYIRLDSALGCVNAVLPVPMCPRRRHHHSDGVPHITLEQTIFVNFVCAVREKHRVQIVVLSFAMKVNWRNQPMGMATRARTRTQLTQHQLWNYCAPPMRQTTAKKKLNFENLPNFVDVTMNETEWTRTAAWCCANDKMPRPTTKRMNPLGNVLDVSTAVPRR